MALALAAAGCSFVLLAGTAKTTDLRVKGQVRQSFRAAYDILVRPRGSFTPLERKQGLVRANYLSGIFGGITLAQYGAVRRIRGVEVAAPIANVGYVLPLQNVRLSLDDVVDDARRQLYRLEVTWVAQGGASRYPGGALYVYYTRNEFINGRGGIAEYVAGRGWLPVCRSFNESLGVGPFAPWSYLGCFSRRSPGKGFDKGDPGLGPEWMKGKVGSIASISFPVAVAAIDPVQEAKLLRLPRALVAGRYLRSGESWFVTSKGRSVKYRAVPVLASTKTFVDERLVVDVERLRVPKGRNVVTELASPSARRFLTRLDGDGVARLSFSAENVYRRLLRTNPLESFSYWTTSATTYRRGSDGILVPQPATNPTSVWKSPFQPGTGGYWPAPPSNRDVQFRRLTPFVGSNVISSNGTIRTPNYVVVGSFDPARLPGFDPLSRVPLETYYPPVLKPADDAARRALNGARLLPTQNLGDYVQQPPLLLTTLAAMEPFLNGTYFRGAGKRRAAPISVIRVRVRGVTGPDALSMARIRAVAVAIRERTGLDVDVTAGSSPRELVVEVPAGKFGRPALRVREGWVKKGVSVLFLRAADRKTLGLSALILLACILFVANSVLAAVRTRRAELGTLLCVGWSRFALFSAVVGEIALVGAAAGLIGTALAVLVVWLWPLSMPLLEATLVLPLGLALALVAGVGPAWAATRLTPLALLRPAVSESRRGRRVNGLLGFAWTNVARVPRRSLLAAVALGGGVCALALLLAITRSFEGTFAGTLLGRAILLRVRAADYISVALTLALACLSLAQVLYLNLRERAPELVALRTSGWTDRHLAWTLCLESLLLGFAAGVAGAIAAAAAGRLLLDLPLAELALCSCLAAAGALVVALIASVVPLRRLRRLDPAAVFADA